VKSGWSVPGVAIALLFSAAAPASPEVDAAYPAAHALYVELHQHPELSGHEVQTAATLAQQLRALGSSTHVYGHSHVNRRVMIDGVTYINNAFGYPSESHFTARELVQVR